MNFDDLTNINLRNDIIFKYVFAMESTEDILIDLLNAIFLDSGQEQITEITYMNPLNLKEYLLDKTTVIDIKARDGKGRYYNIEMQVQSEQHFVERVIYYNSKLLTGQLGESQGYDKLNKTISIIFTDFILLKNEKAIHNIYRLLNVRSHKELADLVEYHFIELPKYKDDEKYGDPINQWLFALVNGESFISDPGTMPDLIKKEKMIMKAIKRMQKAAADPDLRAIMEYREKAVHDEADRLSFAHEKGIKIGEERGIMIGKEEGIMIGKEVGKEEGIMIGSKKAMEAVALEMMSNGIDIDTVIKFTKLSRQDIQKLQQ